VPRAQGCAAAAWKKSLVFKALSVTVRCVLAHIGLRHSLWPRNSARSEHFINSSLDRTASHLFILVGTSDQATRRTINVI
jgi:hypothetical protein